MDTVWLIRVLITRKILVWTYKDSSYTIVVFILSLLIIIWSYKILNKHPRQKRYHWFVQWSCCLRIQDNKKKNKSKHPMINSNLRLNISNQTPYKPNPTQSLPVFRHCYVYFVHLLSTSLIYHKTGSYWYRHVLPYVMSLF